MKISHQRENIIKRQKLSKKNQMEILGLKKYNPQNEAQQQIGDDLR